MQARVTVVKIDLSKRLVHVVARTRSLSTWVAVAISLVQIFAKHRTLRVLSSPEHAWFEYPALMPKCSWQLSRMFDLSLNKSV